MSLEEREVIFSWRFIDTRPRRLDLFPLRRIQEINQEEYKITRTFNGPLGQVYV